MRNKVLASTKVVVTVVTIGVDAGEKEAEGRVVIVEVAEAEESDVVEAVITVVQEEPGNYFEALKTGNNVTA